MRFRRGGCQAATPLDAGHARVHEIIVVNEALRHVADTLLEAHRPEPGQRQRHLGGKVHLHGGFAWLAHPRPIAVPQLRGELPYFAGVIADANGNLFGTTYFGGAGNSGTVFEIAKTAGGYASTPTTLVSFNSTNGGHPWAGVIADANGNLFGTTGGGGAYGYGTVFEVTKTAGGYASTPTTLVSFNGASTAAGVIADADGNLFGTTYSGGASNLGTVFEITKTAGGYASTPITVVSFNGTNGALPYAGLIADANGNLFGTTVANGGGTVFQITDSGFVIPVTFAGTPGKPNCYGQSISALARHYGGLNGAAAALGYADVSALQSAILTFCEG
jgi:uncharacterized repeat protein (TIGR03803 family)